MAKPLIGISMGDPAGVGPELALRAATNERILKLCRPVIFGNSWVLSDVMAACGPDVQASYLPAIETMAAEGHLQTIQPAKDRVFAVPCAAAYSQEEIKVTAGKVDAFSGQMSFNYVSAAIDAALAGHIAAVVTAPIHKQAWSAAGITYPGHTELFAEKSSTEEYCMMMTSPRLSCSLVTCHLGLAEAVKQISTERIVEVIRLTHMSLSRILSREPRLVVLGLNPHAGEGGLFGEGEESSLIRPAIEQAKQLGYEVVGPVPPDTAFVPAKLEEFDGHICMYHDQGLIPFKALAFDTGVNVTLGLPIVRTSVDHGTALDIAWTGKADVSSMLAAVELAAKLSASHSPEGGNLES